jgi:cobaltochelatase CobS
MQTTTTTTSKTALEIEIQSTKEKILFGSHSEAVEFLIDCELIAEAHRDTKSPFLALNEAVKKGAIKVNFSPEKADDRPKLELKPTPEPRPVPKTPKIEFTEFTEIKPEPKQEQQPVNTANLSKDPAALLSLLGEFIKPQGPAQLDVDQVRQIIKEEINKQEPKRIEVTTEKATTEIKGLIHKDFEKCLKIVAAGKNLWLYGPAGSGKSHTAIQIAQALNLPFYFIPTSAQSTKIDFLGYNSATGEYIKTPFYDAYKNGGIFLADEIDAANPNTLVTLNAALSNKKMFFAGELVEMHKDFRLIAGANTKGSGATSQFSGRNPIDGATKDRFIFFYFGYDEELELKLSPVKDFCKKVQELRAKAVKLGSTAIISPRASIDGGDLINLGFSLSEALDMVIFNKLDEATTNLLK